MTKMRPLACRIFLSLSLLACSEWFICGDIKSQTLSNPTVATPDRESLIRQSILQIHQEKYDSVLANCAILREQYPDDPAGYLIPADVYQTIMSDYRVRIFEAEFDSLIELTIKMVRKSLKTDATPDNYFIWGVAEGYRSFHRFRRGEWLSAINSARTCIKSLRFANKLDTSFVDPLLGLALFEYGKSKALSLGLDLFSKKRKKAITMLKRTEKDGRYVSTSASYALQLIYYETGQFGPALELNDKLSQEFPTNPVGLYNRALLFEKMDRLADAIDIWKKLISRIEAFEQPSNNYLAECHYHLADLYRKLGQTNSATEELAKAEKYAGLYRRDQEMDGPYTNFKDIRKAINRARKDL
jgi:tetratricopeptide (TPR) repeat protein